VCVCVCVRERERERERDSWNQCIKNEKYSQLRSLQLAEKLKPGSLFVGWLVGGCVIFYTGDGGKRFFPKKGNS